MERRAPLPQQWAEVSAGRQWNATHRSAPVGRSADVSRAAPLGAVALHAMHPCVQWLTSTCRQQTQHPLRERGTDVCTSCASTARRPVGECPPISACASPRQEISPSMQRAAPVGGNAEARGVRSRGALRSNARPSRRLKPWGDEACALGKGESMAAGSAAPPSPASASARANAARAHRELGHSGLPETGRAHARPNRKASSSSEVVRVALLSPNERAAWPR
jgi:hypothetical protein